MTVRARLSKSSLTGLLIATLLGGCPPASETQVDATATALDDLGVTTDLLAGWALESSRTDPGGQWRSASFTRSGSTVRVRAFTSFDRDRFRRFREEQDSLLQGLFGTRPASYPGHLTNELECPPRFQPKRVELTGGDTAYSLYAGERLSFGGCGEDMLVYRAGLRFLHCEQDRTALRIEAFVPKEQDPSLADKLVRSFGC